MKAIPVSQKRVAAQRAWSALGPVIEGSLCAVRRGGPFRWQLTDRPSGKTRTLYVPAARAEEVRTWTANWKEAKKLLRQLSEASREELRDAAGRAGARPHRHRTEARSQPS